MESDDGRIRVLSFALGGQLCGLAIDEVQEVLQLVALTPIPDAPAYLAGACNLRGRVLPVVDLASLIGNAPQPYTLDTPIVVVSQDGHVAGLVVDSVNDVVELDAEDVDEPSSVFPLRKLLSGVARTPKGLMMLFQLDRVLRLASGALELTGEAERA